MERTVNGNVVIQIKEIIKFIGSNDHYEIYVITKDNVQMKLVFRNVVMAHYMEENGFINRGHHLQRCEETSSSLLRIENSQIIEQWGKLSKDDYALEGLKEFLLIDGCFGDTVVEIVTYDDPQLVEVKEKIDKVI